MIVGILGVETNIQEICVDKHIIATVMLCYREIKNTTRRESKGMPLNNNYMQ